MRPAHLTVVIPNYNHAQYLPTCLEAVLGQSRRAEEIIILDDASTDNSIDVIERYRGKDSTIQVYRNGTNQGVVAGMNRGLQMARNDYVYFAAADDQIFPGLFEKSLSLLEQYPEAGLCCSIGELFEQDTGLRWHAGAGMADKPGYLSPGKLLALERQGRLRMTGHTAVMNRKAFQAAGGFIPELKWYCDWFAMYVAGLRHGICFVPEPLARLNLLSSSFGQTGTRNDEAHRASLQAMLNLLMQDAYQDVRMSFRDGAALGAFGLPILKLLFQHPSHRYFLTTRFLRKNLWMAAKLEGKKRMPRKLAELYLQAFYKASSAQRG